MDGDHLAEVLADDWLGDVAAHPMERLRAMRSECQQLETGVSYVRRLVQGRLDIVTTIRRRRAEGGGDVQVSALVQQLGDILADRGRPAGFGRLPTQLVPAAAAVDTSELDAVVPAGRLGDLPSLDDRQLADVEERLGALEQQVSASRRALHQRIDVLQAEMTRRYREGEASVESLLP